MKHFLITLLIFGLMIFLGHLIAYFCETEYLKLNIMFLFGVIGCSIVRLYEMHTDDIQEDDEFKNF